MKKMYLIVTMLLIVHVGLSQGNQVFSGSEAVNYGIISLATPGGQTWVTNRTATPGYFSLFGTAVFSDTSDAANINGYVKHYVSAANQGALFPVGTGADQRYLKTSGSIANSSVFTTAWILGDPSSVTDPTDGGVHSTAALGTGIGAVNTTGYWDWQDVSSTGNGTTITVSIPDVSSFSGQGLLRMVGWNGSQWINLSATQGNTAATGNTENHTLTGTMQSAITAIGIGQALGVTVNVKAFLQGAYSGGVMSTTLNSSNLIPLAQPYNVSPWSYAGTETVATIPSGVTDWVLLELRDATTPSTIVATRAAFIKSDGSIVDTDGTSAVSFAGISAGNYHIAIKHRNHLAIRTATAQALTAGGAPSLYDFTTAQTQAYQDAAITTNAAMQSVSGVFVMWGGNGNANSAANYGAFGSDRIAILNNPNTPGLLSRGLGTNPTTSVSNVYGNCDVNMNGTINYGAFGSDRIFLLNSGLGTAPTATKTQHL